MSYYVRFHFDFVNAEDGKPFDINEWVRQVNEWINTPDKHRFNDLWIFRMDKMVEAYNTVGLLIWTKLSHAFKDETSWRDWQDDFRVISKHLPDVLFSMEWSGEENGDLGHAQFLCGKARIVKAVIPDIKEAEWT
jgi:hypothetical protein